ncbi:hypothetical protein [uncultured Nocardioides sp.]|uniref:hypothetical protein n=1 Tax=uncultured Nocardioides sp. TaxID=198441 RepID=UPI0025D02367|nr:hypothetical protein [uncultured Nocardioides sp.]
MSTTQQSSSTDAAKGETKRVAGVASDEAQNVAQEAKAQARGLLDDARSQVDDQSRTQLGNLKDLLTRVSDDLEQMVSSSEGGGLAADAARAVSERARGLSSHLEGREPTDLLDDVRDYARRRPGTFLLGALAAGVVAGRLARGAKQGTGSTSSTGYRTGSAYGTGTTTASDTDVLPVQDSAVTGVGTGGVDPLTGPLDSGPAAASGSPVADRPFDDDLSTDPLGDRHASPSSTTGEGGLR